MYELQGCDIGQAVRLRNRGRTGTYAGLECIHIPDGVARFPVIIYLTNEGKIEREVVRSLVSPDKIPKNKRFAYIGFSTISGVVENDEKYEFYRKILGRK